MPTDAPETPARPGEPAATPRDSAVRDSGAGAIRSTKPRQVRPKTEGWQQQKGADGRPLLQFASPKRGKPPAHLADLAPEEWKAKAEELGVPAFRLKQVARHDFTRWTSDQPR